MVSNGAPHSVKGWEHRGDGEKERASSPESSWHQEGKLRQDHNDKGTLMSDLPSAWPGWIKAAGGKHPKRCYPPTPGK